MQEAEILSGHPVEATVPFALWLLPANHRVYAQALYQFARGADDVADDPILPKDAKEAHLRRLRQCLQEGEAQGLPPYARDFATLVRRKRVKLQPALDVLHALTDDVHHTPVRDYEELLAYSQLVSVPVGQMALELLDETDVDRTASDALCIALQLLNVVRDASKDYLVLQRIYLPGDWLRQGGVPPEDLAQSQLSQRLRGTMLRVLDRAGAFLDAARPLPSSIHSWRLRILLRTVHIMARMLLLKLRSGNPLAARIQLTQWEKFQAMWQATLEELIPGRRKQAASQSTPEPELTAENQ